jgi:hypothetical protein
MKIAFLLISSEIIKKVFRGRVRNALTIVALSTLLSYFFLSGMHLDTIRAQIGPLNTETTLSPSMPFPISMPFGSTEDVPGNPRPTSTSGFSTLSGCSKLPIPAIKASSSLSSSPPSYAIDGNLNTRWSSLSAYTSWIQADLGSVKTACYAAIAWYPQTEKNRFAISVSTDGVNFKNVLSSQSSGGVASQYETYDFPDTNARYVRITVFRSGELDSSQTYTQISELAVYGASASSSPTPPSTLYDDFQSGTYSLRDGQISPNGKWHNIYNGGGSSGVLYANSVNKIFYMFPKTATSPGESSASAVETTKKFSNFELSLSVKTVKQLRLNSPPNPWEAATIIFRQTDYWHYYAFVVKTNGIEFDKKDCNTCTDPVQGQRFLVTLPNPKLKIGSYSNWKITAIGNHFTIAVDGIKVIDYIDSTMSSKLASGSIVLYNEDANAHFDNVYITPK